MIEKTFEFQERNSKLQNRWGFGIVVLMCSVLCLIIFSNIVSAEMTISGPDSVKRGNDSFTVIVNETVRPSESYYFGLIINPQTMTGDVCDRPPYIIDDFIYSKIPGQAWDAYYEPEQDKGEKFYELSPNNLSYPSNSTCWDVPWNGTHYMVELWADQYNTGDWYLTPDGIWHHDINIGLRYPDFSTSVKPGEYTFHVQKASAHRKPNLPKPVSPVRKIDFEDYKVNIVVGGFDFSFYDYSAYYSIPPELIPVNSAGKGEKVILNGTNFDSDAIYLWITGEGLPKCGTSLKVNNLPVNSNDPLIVGFTDRKNGTWEYKWDISETILEPGKYTIYASTINPDDLVTEFFNRPNECGSICKTREEGVCALLDCPTCTCLAPIIKKDFTITELTTNINSIDKVEPCCCPGYPCGFTSSLVNITLSGIFGDSRTPMQIWMFGNNQIYDKNYLFTDNFTTFLDADGSFQLDIYEYLLKPNGLDLCDLDNGEYYLLVQLPGQTNQSKQVFDVTLENSTFYKKISTLEPNTFLMSNLTKDNLYVVKSDPFFWTKAFPVLGPNSYTGKRAFDKLTTLLDEAWVRDRYVTTSFFLEPIRCKQDALSFIATPQEGYVPLTVQFTDQSTFNGTAYSWDFGDGLTSTEKNPQHIYNKSGIYDVTLTIEGTGTDGKQKNPLRKYNYIIVRDIPAKYYDPVADFTISKVANEPFSIQFIDQSYGATPLTSIWDFGDNSTSGEKSPKHQYASAGTYTVNLTVKDQYDKESTKTQDILVPSVSPPVPDFEFTINPNQMKQVQFTDKSQGEITSWKWTFGDGLGSSIQSPEHLYTTYGTFSVTLTVGNNAGSQSFTKEITLIDPKVSADFSWEDIGERTVRFLDNSKGLITEWTLEYGDGKVDQFTEAWDEVEHTYSQLGRYYAKLTVKNDYNKDSVTKQIDVLKRQ
ncbi:PKD [Methanospirillum hungatei JF-1]|uniref:PKD n=1 Tax=Methanospirillum hungatei JF-1 (strain ATCC 27890 / DSM 864 / NBRC 100397 / JF-1) TaxID=323259 RepID=Q2FPL7_METHJ|nr:PKD domain-containing protein [Methanospirillum hungatei]ABD40186.1 PKD [Methanospirillum hungatei JF-1]